MKTTILNSLILTAAILLPTIARAESQDYTYSIIDGTVAITGYKGPGGPAIIPNTIDGLAVTSVADRAFFGCTIITSVKIPNTVTHIGDYAFYSCTRVASVDLPESLTNIGEGAFSHCGSLAHVNMRDQVTRIPDWTFYSCTNLVDAGIGNAVTDIGLYAFYSCPNLQKVTLGKSLNYIAWYAFRECPSLKRLHFEGNAPAIEFGTFYQTTSATVFYRPDTRGWAANFAGFPTVLWNPLIQGASPTFGIWSNSFDFVIKGTPDIPIAIEASPHLSAETWTSLQVCSLTNGLIRFSDSTWQEYRQRFYRIASP